MRLAFDDGEVADGWFHARGAVDACWRIGELVLRGRWLHWRTGADGRVLRALSHAGATLHGPAGALPLLTTHTP